MLTSGSSRFKGVSWDKTKEKWAANFQNKKLGGFDNEQDAAIAYAKAVISEFPLWAHDSDLLIGSNLLSAAKIQQIVSEVKLGQLQSELRVRSLPKGVRAQGKKFRAIYCGKTLGTFETAEEAKQAYDDHVQGIKDAEWAAYLTTPITRDAEGDAVIALTGQKGTGMFTKVPDRIWHELTFNGSWCFDGKYAARYFKGERGHLHRFVYQLCFPESVMQGTVDHFNPSAKLNNLESNLRDASLTLQAYNKEKKAGCTSKYIGVAHHKANNTWRGQIRHDGKRYNTGYHKKENDAARALNTLAKQLKGDHARILEIED